MEMSGKLSNAKMAPLEATGTDPEECAMVDLGSSLVPLVPRLRRFAQLLTHDVSLADTLIEACLRNTMADVPNSNAEADLERLVFRNLYYCFHQSLENTTLILDAKKFVEIEAGVASLPYDEKLTLLFVVLEDLSYEDVAEIMDVSVTVVRSRLGKARRSLGQVMRSQEPALEPQREAMVPLERSLGT